MTLVTIVLSVMLSILAVFIVIAVFCACVMASIMDNMEEIRRGFNDDGSCSFCGSADDVTCEECRAIRQRGAK